MATNKQEKTKAKSGSRKLSASQLGMMRKSGTKDQAAKGASKSGAVKSVAAKKGNAPAKKAKAGAKAAAKLKAKSVKTQTKTKAKRTKPSRSSRLKERVVTPIRDRAAKAEEEPTAPRITNETVAEHREEVLSGARRFIYPLQHSRHKVVIISSVVIVALLASFILGSTFLLYRSKSTGDLAYRISQIVPFPIARVNGSFVDYEKYLFEIRSTLHYYRGHSQEGVDLDSREGEALTQEFKRQALDKVVLDALAEDLARENGVTVTDIEIDNQIALVRSQGGLGESEAVLADVLKDFYDWSIDDLRRVIRLQIIRRKLPGVLDQATVTEAQTALSELQNGDPFADLVPKYSDDDLTKENAGVIGLISRTNTDLPPEFVETAFSLEPGETSDLVETQFGLHIIRNQKVEGDQVEVAHILFRYFDIDAYLAEKRDETDVNPYIDLGDSQRLDQLESAGDSVNPDGS